MASPDWLMITFCFFVSRASVSKIHYVTVPRPVCRKPRELFGPEKLVVKLHSTCFENLIFNMFLQEEKPRGLRSSMA